MSFVILTGRSSDVKYSVFPDEGCFHNDICEVYPSQVMKFDLKINPDLMGHVNMFTWQNMSHINLATMETE